MKRRTFINNSLVGTAGILAGTSAWAANVPNSANDKVVLALIGAGGRGRSTIINVCKVNKGVEIKYICDVNDVKSALAINEVEKQLGYKPLLVRNMKKPFEDREVDAVWISTPEHWHALATIWALQAGKHVYVEKNPNISIWEGRKMVEASEKYGKVLQIGFQNRSAPYAFSAREFIKSGQLGKVVHVKSYNMLGGSRWSAKPDAKFPAGLDWDAWIGPAPFRNYNPGVHDMESRGGWLNFWDFGGGKLSDDGSHVMDLARLVLGDPGHPRSVYCCGGNWAWGSEGKETPEFQAITYDFGDFSMTCENGSATGYMSKTPGRIRMSDCEFPDWDQNATRTEIYGTEGVMFLGRHGGGWQVFGKGKEIIAQEYGVHPDDWHQKNFIASIRGLEKPNGDPLQGHLSASLVHLGNIAYRAGNKHLVFDGENERFINCEEANQFLKTTYREHYTIPDKV
ncbi:MAG: Gfo/Idh/MocA family oxidoreductase [Bacteroidales bacterium]|nr:Gfo/Idh/MocA family oxidoreductase [Bacteroidales bacterium]